MFSIRLIGLVWLMIVVIMSRHPPHTPSLLWTASMFTRRCYRGNSCLTESCTPTLSSISLITISMDWYTGYRVRSRPSCSRHAASINDLTGIDDSPLGRTTDGRARADMIATM